MARILGEVTSDEMVCCVGLVDEVTTACARSPIWGTNGPKWSQVRNEPHVEWMGVE